ATASTFAALATLGVDRGPAGSTLAGHELGRLLGGGVLFAIPAVSAALGATETSPATPLLASSALTAALAAITALAPRATVDVVEGRALTRELRDLASSKGGGALLTLMATFALGELLVVAALRPYAVDHGFAIADVAAALGVWSGLAAIAGASLGTVIARRGDALRVLGVAAALRIGPLFAAAVVAQAEPAPSSIVGIAVGAAFFGGVVLAAAAELVEATRRVHGAARADALVVVEGLGHGAAWVLAGVLADQHGHLGVFVLGAAAAVVFLWTLGSARRTTRDAT
ncbi:hypothetical protein L6R52_43580, partial [Myxococcota bacterium]|nr:hypothetical protein [Myxococcota bacterium]